MVNFFIVKNQVLNHIIFSNTKEDETKFTKQLYIDYSSAVKLNWLT